MDQTTLYELLECSVCMEVLDGTSKVLPCQHTFCRRCLDEIVATKKHLQCPECRMPVTKRVEDLPPNILLVRLLETMKTMAHQRGNNSQYSTEFKQSTSKHGIERTAKSLVSKPSHPCAKALFNYEAQEAGDLTFKRGDLVRLCKQIDENWYLGEISGQQGYFPATYVEVLIALPDDAPACKALYDFVIDDSNEKDCLTFQKNEVITVLRRIDDNWAEGKLRDRIGIFPISFVEMNDSARCLIGHANQPSANHIGMNPTSCQAVAAVADNKASRASASAFSAASEGVVSSGHPLPMPTAAAMQAVKAPRGMSNHRPSVGVPNGESGLTPIPISSARNKPLPLIYEALYNYKPMKEDEIELKKGECYTVLHKCRDGWFKGRSLSTGVFGIFPGNYVKQIVLLPLDDLSLVRPSISSAAGGHVTVSRTNSLCANRHRAATKTVTQGIHNEDVSEAPSGPSHRPRSRPITNITQAQIRNAANVMTTVANSAYLSSPNNTSGVGASCSPTWLNLMTSPHVAADLSGVSGHSKSSGRNKVHRSVTCRAHSVSRMPLTAVVNTRSVSDSLDSEDLRTMLRGLSLKEMNSASVDCSANGGCQVVAGESATVFSGFGLATDSDKMDKRLSLIKRWTSGISKGRKPTSTQPTVTTSLETSFGPNVSSAQPSTHQDRCGTFSVKSTDGSLTSCGQPTQKPVRVSLMKVLPISLSAVQSKSVNRDLYKCVMPYPAQNENELELKVGDVVYVVHKHDDGWFKGVLQRTGKIGLFPGSFVQNVGSS